MQPPGKSIVLFDGHCHLCSRLARWIIRHDRKDAFRLAPLQSVPGADVLRRIHADVPSFEYLVLVENGRLFISSTAALRIARRLGGLTAGWYALILVPRFIRDRIYLLIARNRYRWFGKSDTCFVPDAAIRNKFL